MIRFDFNDIAIIPKTNVRLNDINADINLPITLPLITAPSNTLINFDNINDFINNKIHIILPKTIGFDRFKEFYDTLPKRKKSPFDIKLNPYFHNLFIAVNFNDLDIYYRNNFKIFYENTSIFIDAANGHMQKIIDYCKEIKRLRPDIIIMTGNICNPETYWRYAENDCVDYIRIGSINEYKHSGIGYPIASLIQDVYQQKEKFIEHNKINIHFQDTLLHTVPVKKIPAIVADCIKNNSDIIKAFALGADYVMIPSLPITKIKKWIDDLEFYLRNAMFYTDAKTLNDFIGKVEITQITKNSYDRFNY
jgi:hypothetical protein